MMMKSRRGGAPIGADADPVEVVTLDAFGLPTTLRFERRNIRCRAALLIRRRYGMRPAEPQQQSGHCG